MNAKFIPALNLTGKRYAREGSNDVGLLEYKSILSMVGVEMNEEIFCDTDKRFYEFVRCRISDFIGHKTMRSEIKEISWCSCGVVEICNFHLNSVNPNKLDFIEKRSNIFFCKKCGTSLETKKETVWTYEIPKVERPIKILGRSIPAINERLQSDNFRKIISRNHRVGVIVKVSDEEINLDVDFYWSMYLDYLLSIHHNDEIVVVVGSGSVNEFKQCIALTSSINIHRIKGVVYPLLVIRDNQKIFERPISELFLLGENSNTIRTFLSLGFSWNQSPAILTRADLHLARMSTGLICKDSFERSDTKIFSSLDICISMFNRNNVQSGLKKIRSKKTMDDFESKLFSSIITPD